MKGEDGGRIHLFYISIYAEGFTRGRSTRVWKCDMMWGCLKRRRAETAEPLFDIKDLQTWQRRVLANH